MNLASAGVIKELCEKYKIRPSKKWGQNFLIDRNILDKIVKTADLKKTDIVLEVGPGFGVLTQELAKRVKKVIAVEIDKRLVEALEETTSDKASGITPYDRRVRHRPRRDARRLQVINKDILQLDISSLKFNKIIANLPYQITGAVIRKFLENKSQPELMVLMIQKEVAQRICSKPPDMSLLSVSVQFYGEPKIISKVSKNSFWPVPKVDSSIIKITPISRRNVDPEEFFKIVRAGFSNPRKQLKNNLKIDASVLEKIGLNKKIRAEELSVEDWVKIAKYF